MITTDLFVTKAFPKLTFFKFAPFLEVVLVKQMLMTQMLTLLTLVWVLISNWQQGIYKLNTVYRKAFENDGGPKGFIMHLV